MRLPSFSEFTLVYVAAFLFVLFTTTSMASAQLVLEYATYSAYALPGQAVTFTFAFKNTGNSEVIVGFTGVSMPGILEWHAAFPATRFAPGETKTIAMAATLSSQAPKKFDAYLVTDAAPAGSAPRIIPLFLVFADGSVPPQQQPSPATSPVSNKSTASFCSSGPQGSLVIQKAKLRSSGKKTTWVAGNTLDVEVEVENKGTKALDDVVVELGLRNSKGANEVRELDFTSSDKQRHNFGDLSAGEEESTKFSFTIPASLDEGTYRLLLKAYARGQESGACTESVADFDLTTAQTIKVEREENEQRAIVFDRVSLSPSPLICGEQAQLTARVSNIGDEDEERIKISLASKDFGLSLTKEIASGLDEGDDVPITFAFAIPSILNASSYTLELSAESEYKNGAYRVRSEIPRRVLVQVTCTRSSAAPAAGKEKPLTLSRIVSEEENKVSPSGTRFALSAPQKALGIGILILLVVIVIVALTRRPARRQGLSRGSTTALDSTGTPPRRPGRPSKAQPLHY